MEAWQERLIKERDEVNARGQKLANFIREAGGKFDDLDRDTQIQLIAQLAYMGPYSEILDERCEKFKN